ncbi:MAG: TetR/AcrR family transcriptional regulator [Firmicutes bacterium]|nr:TetR/AcrR family transcriptional regulator [Bacillota bacterium]MCM1394008.1 TetR/AcrR family transcriptional regulator [[Eubacterium] siraeum]
MPPKPKFTREQIVAQAFEIVREKGLDSLTARYLGERLNSSARPIFTVFDSMDEVVSEVMACAKGEYAKYVSAGLASVPAFKGVGTQYIRFAVKEPQLFRLLFMNVNEQANLRNILPLIDDNAEEILMSVRESYGLDDVGAKRIYMHLWVYTHGIATMCATRTCKFTEEEISEIMSEVFVSLLKTVKGETR